MNRIFWLLLLVFSLPVYAEVAVIVHPSNGNDLNAGSIAHIFLGKSKAFGDGSQAVPIMQSGGSVTDAFNDKVLSKNSSQLKAYWSKLLFTGQGTPPREVGSDQEVIKLVGSNPNLIGYVDAGKVDGSVKVVGKY